MLFTRVCVWSVFASLSALLPCSVTQLPAMLVLYLADCLLLAWASVECQSRTCAGRQNLLRGRKAEFVTWGDSCELTIHSAMIPCLGRSIRCRHVPPTTQRSRARCWPKTRHTQAVAKCTSIAFHTASRPLEGCPYAHSTGIEPCAPRVRAPISRAFSHAC